jgi:cytochrome P450
MQDNDLPATAIVDPTAYTDVERLHGMLARLRRVDPLPYVQAEGYSPFWLVTRYADIIAIEQDPKRFINAPRQAIFPLSYERRNQEMSGKPTKDLMRNVVAMDGDEHRAYRAIAQSRFLPNAMTNMRQSIESLASEFVQRMAALGERCDFAGDVAKWYPLRVIMNLFGVPPQDEALMLRLTQQILSSQDPEFAQESEGSSIHAMMEMAQYFAPIVKDRRSNPRDDLASVVANAIIDGQLLSDRDVFGYFLIITTAGHDTTSYSLTGGLLALLQNAEQMARLRAEPTLIPMAVDEMIRWSTPVRQFCRTATEDRTIRGQQIKAGDVLLLSYPSANRDEEVFADPFAFRIDRKPNRHLAFGTGPHVCLGQHLAKLELVSFLREFLARVETVELAGQPRFVASSFVGGVKELPIRYRFRKPVNAAA